jgi:hypothetical protein
MDATDAIHEIIDRETHAWNTQDVRLLLSIFHPDFVWPWPCGPQGHDPINWELPQGKFDPERWGQIYAELFARTHLAHNRRITQRVTVSAEGDGALAVVDVDTLWIDNTTGTREHWLGRAGKVYASTSDGWKLTMHTGLLDYGDIDPTSN